MLENTTFDKPVSPSVPGSPSAAKPDISRYVFEPIRTKSPADGSDSSEARIFGPLKPPKARPALGGTVTVKGGDEIYE